MQITLNDNDISKLKPETVADIWSLIGAQKRGGKPMQADDTIDYDDVADLSINQVIHFMETVSAPVVNGLKYIAEHGPRVHGNELLENAEVPALKDFQGATTKRVRKITGVDDAMLLGWDDWTKYADGIGYYAVTNVTYDSLRRYFKID